MRFISVRVSLCVWEYLHRAARAVAEFIGGFRSVSHRAVLFGCQNVMGGMVWFLRDTSFRWEECVSLAGFLWEFELLAWVLVLWADMVGASDGDCDRESNSHGEFFSGPGPARESRLNTNSPSPHPPHDTKPLTTSHPTLTPYQPPKCSPSQSQPSTNPRNAPRPTPRCPTPPRPTRPRSTSRGQRSSPRTPRTRSTSSSRRPPSWLWRRRWRGSRRRCITGLRRRWGRFLMGGFSLISSRRVSPLLPHALVVIDG